MTDEFVACECETCDGDGWVERPERMIGESDDPCPDCDGTGTVLAVLAPSD